MSRRSPYCCGRCRGRSLLIPKHNTVAALVTLAAVALCALAIPWLGIPKTIGCFLGLYIFVVGGIMWVFMQLRPVET
jgi:hypothetical protein